MVVTSKSGLRSGLVDSGIYLLIWLFKFDVRDALLAQTVNVGPSGTRNDIIELQGHK
jgi:hypothetical protein